MRGAFCLTQLEPFYYDGPALFPEEALAAPAEGYLMRSDLAARPAPDL